MQERQVIQGRDGICGRVEERRDCRRTVGVVPRTAQFRLLCRLSLPVLRPSSSRCHSRARLASQDH